MDFGAQLQEHGGVVPTSYSTRTMTRRITVRTVPLRKFSIVVLDGRVAGVPETIRGGRPCLPIAQHSCRNAQWRDELPYVVQSHYPTCDFRTPRGGRSRNQKATAKKSTEKKVAPNPYNVRRPKAPTTYSVLRRQIAQKYPACSQDCPQGSTIRIP